MEIEWQKISPPPQDLVILRHITSLFDNDLAVLECNRKLLISYTILVFLSHPVKKLFSKMRKIERSTKTKFLSGSTNICDANQPKYLVLLTFVMLTNPNARIIELCLLYITFRLSRTANYKTII